MLGTAYNEHWSTLYSVLLTNSFALRYNLLYNVQLDAQIQYTDPIYYCVLVQYAKWLYVVKYILVLDSLQLRGVCPSNMSMAWWRGGVWRVWPSVCGVCENHARTLRPRSSAPPSRPSRVDLGKVLCVYSLNTCMYMSS